MAERFFAKLFSLENASTEMTDLQTNKQVSKDTITVTPVSAKHLVVTYYNDIPVVTLASGAIVSYEYGSDIPVWSTLVDVTDGDSSTGYTYVVSFNDLDMNTLGTYTVSVTVLDSSGNRSNTLDIDITIVDTTKPIINDAETLVVTYVSGSSAPASWLNGITTTDGYDGDLTASIVVDSSAVDMTTVGTFTITYDVDDSSGNSATQLSKTITITSAE